MRILSLKDFLTGLAHLLDDLFLGGSYLQPTLLANQLAQVIPPLYPGMALVSQARPTGEHLDHIHLILCGHLCRATRLTPLTLANYRSAGSALVRHMAGARWDELDEEDVREVATLDLGVSTRSRLLTVMGRVIEFLQEELGMDVAGLNRSTVRLARRLRPVNLPSMEHVAQMLAHLLAWRQRALAQKLPAKARLAYDAFLAILLATFFGLRRREIAHLRLGDVVLDAQTPYLRVWRSKRGKSRVVWARHVPPEVLDLLRAWWQRRWEAAGGDPAARFLDSAEDETLTESLGRAVNAAIRVLEIKQDPGALPITFHTLRHVYANRLLVLGVPLIEIARSLGHAGTDTTTGSYLHTFDWLQHRRLDEWLAAQPKSGVTASQIGTLMGIRRPAVLSVLKKAPPGEVEDWYEESRHLYPWTMGVRLLASRLQMDGKQPGDQIVQPEPSPADMSGRVLAIYYRVFNQNHHDPLQALTAELRGNGLAVHARRTPPGRGEAGSATMQISQAGSTVFVLIKKTRCLTRQDMEQLEARLRSGNWPVGLVVNFGSHRPQARRVYNDAHSITRSAPAKSA
ncbi:MAG: tyrosine-type recombinase/integrase [Thermoflexales bacterium]|nr:tyrosine-type recombinase/integrase [Thermoflexales bacterium]